MVCLDCFSSRLLGLIMGKFLRLVSTHQAPPLSAGAGGRHQHEAKGRSKWKTACKKANFEAEMVLLGGTAVRAKSPRQVIPQGGRSFRQAGPPAKVLEAPGPVSRPTSPAEGPATHIRYHHVVKGAGSG
jgi:hypothetical protein